ICDASSTRPHRTLVSSSVLPLNTEPMNIGAVDRKITRKVPIWFSFVGIGCRSWYVLSASPQNHTANVAADSRQNILAKSRDLRLACQHAAAAAAAARS